MLSINRKSVSALALVCMCLSMICKMLFQINQNGTLRLLGYGLQLLIIVLYTVELFLGARRIAFSWLKLLLIILVAYMGGRALLTNSIYMPYTPIDILIWPLSIIVYYNSAFREAETESANSKMMVLFYFVICAISVPLIIIHLSGRGNIGQVVFLTYFCITSLPLVLLLVNNDRVKKICMVLAIMVSVASTKRAGTIALLISVFAWYVVEAHIQGSLREKKRKYLRLFVLLCGGVGVVIYLDNSSSLQIFERFAKLSTDGGSGRDVIWNIIFNAFDNSKLAEQWLGHGFQSVYYVLRPGGFYRFAHNSYIEFLYDYGIIGVMLLVAFVLFMVFMCLNMIRRKSKYAPAMSMMVIISIILSVFSYYFEESNMIMPVAVGIGLALGLDRRDRIKANEVQYNRSRL